MAEQLCCSKGHCWAPAFAPDQRPVDFRSSCPVCGKAPIRPGDLTIRTTLILAVLAVPLAVGGLALLLRYGNILPLHLSFFILLGAVALPAAGLETWAARRRTKKMASVADAINFDFMAHLLMAGLRAIAPFQLFALGNFQKAYNALLGRVGDCDVIFFEYQYTIGSGKSSKTHRISVVILPDGVVGAPNFQLSPLTLLERITGVSTKGVGLEDVGGFSRNCKLVSRDVDALRKTFHTELVEYLGRDGRWHIEVLNGQMLLHRQTRLKPDKCSGMVMDALEVRDLLRGVEPSNF